MKRFRRICALFLLLAIGLAPSALAKGVVELSEAERLAMNEFLSAFTEAGIDTDRFSCRSPESMVYFDYYHHWYNANNSFVFGDYSEDYNCRFPADDAQETIARYFNVSSEIDLSKSNFGYDGEFIYGYETGGNMNGGFALTLAAYETDPNEYYVAFLCFGVGCDWESDDIALSFSEAEEKYRYSGWNGCAELVATDLSDPSTYRMNRFIH